MNPVKQVIVAYFEERVRLGHYTMVPAKLVCNAILARVRRATGRSYSDSTVYSYMRQLADDGELEHCVITRGWFWQMQYRYPLDKLEFDGLSKENKQ